MDGLAGECRSIRDALVGSVVALTYFQVAKKIGYAQKRH